MPVTSPFATYYYWAHHCVNLFFKSTGKHIKEKTLCGIIIICPNIKWLNIEGEANKEGWCSLFFTSHIFMVWSCVNLAWHKWKQQQISSIKGSLFKNLLECDEHSLYRQHMSCAWPQLFKWIWLALSISHVTNSSLISILTICRYYSLIDNKDDYNHFFWLNHCCLIVIKVGIQSTWIWYWCNI